MSTTHAAKTSQRSAYAIHDRKAATLALDQSVSHVRLVSAQRTHILKKLSIKTVRDLVMHYPRRYLDLSEVASIADARIGSELTIVAEVHEVKLKTPRPRLSLVEISLVDDTGILIVTVFRQPWLINRLSVGDRLAVAGKLEFDFGFKRMTNPFIDVLYSVQTSSPTDQMKSVHSSLNHRVGRVVPIHPACEQISATMMRRLVGNALNLVAGNLDPIPVELRAKSHLMSRGRALVAIHFPESMEEAAQARKRLAYEELLLLELALMLKSQERSLGGHSVCHITDGSHVRALGAALPFALTKDQARAIEDVFAQLASKRCANHLVLGDVGTGKTLVAAFAVAAVADTATQALFLAPTEVLACQHAQSLGQFFDTAGITWELLTGATPAPQRAAIVERVKNGTVDVLIGTHVLLEPDVEFANCSLVVIDEQQRFGVEQRKAALAKGVAPDALHLTATPIPRTLALAVFGDMTLSYLTQRPTGSLHRTTVVLRHSDRGRAYDAARAAVDRGEQVYVVCPLIGRKDTLSTNEQKSASAYNSAKHGHETYGLFEERYEYASIRIEDDADFDLNSKTIRVAAEQEAAFLQTSVFPQVKVELLHGRLSAEQKSEVMERFRAGTTSVVVTTTIIEVGIDVPNATVMIIENADCFGLSQLHQLRGRVGRDGRTAEVFLVSSSKSEAALKRLAAMEQTDDGFELASYDLSLRREGDILGNRQHGASSLKLVNIVRDRAIVEVAHADAAALLEDDPTLTQPKHAALAHEVRIVMRKVDAQCDR